MMLARVSAVEVRWLPLSAENEPRVVVDTLVLPAVERDFCVDARTEVTGLSVDDLLARGVPAREARRAFQAALRPDTVLVGHAVDHDLLALGLRWTGSVVATSLLFAVEGNPDATHGLRHLCETVLRAATERDARGGAHDSVEDALLALRLVDRLLRRDYAFPIELPRGRTRLAKSTATGAAAQIAFSKVEAARVAARAAFERAPSLR